MFRFSGLEFSNLTLRDAAILLANVKAKQKKWIVATPNVNHVMRARRDKSYYQLLTEMDVLFADGMPIVWASRLMGRGLPERVTGADLLPSISQVANEKKGTIFLAGGTSEIELNKARDNIISSFSQLTVLTYFPRYGFEKSERESMALIQSIRDSSADVIFLGVGSPKQERWLIKYKKELPAGAYIGCGMAIGFAAKTVRRSPKIFQKLGLEWIWRISQEPKRLFMRYILDLEFIFIALYEILRVRL